MALSDLVPVIERSRRAAINRSTRAVLQLVPNLRELPQERASSRIFYGVLGAILALSLLAILTINIALSSDAVRIRELKLEVISITEAREAALREVNTLSTPERLAESARKLGMVPSSTPIFIDLTVEQSVGGR